MPEKYNKRTALVLDLPGMAAALTAAGTLPDELLKPVTAGLESGAISPETIKALVDPANQLDGQVIGEQVAPPPVPPDINTTADLSLEVAAEFSKASDDNLVTVVPDVENGATDDIIPPADVSIDDPEVIAASAPAEQEPAVESLPEAAPASDNPSTPTLEDDGTPF